MKKISSRIDYSTVDMRWMVIVGSQVKYASTLEAALTLQDRMMLEAQGRK